MGIEEAVFFFCAERELGKQGGKWDNTNNAMRFEGDIKSQGFCKGHFIFDLQKYVQHFLLHGNNIVY